MAPRPAQVQAMSYWEKDVWLSRVDVVVCGTGLVGLQAALAMRDKYPHAKITIIDRWTIGAGASTRNAGFACFGSPTELLADMLQMTLEETTSLYARRYAGIRRLLEICPPGTMDYEPSGGYEVFRHEDEDAYEKAIRELPVLNAALEDITDTRTTFEPYDEGIKKFGLNGASHLIKCNGEGLIHPGKLVAHLSAMAMHKNIQILKGVNIVGVEEEGEGCRLVLENQITLKAKQCIVATNGFTKTLFPDLPIQPARNQVLVTTPIPGLKLSGAFHVKEGYIYFRPLHGRILIGGMRHIDKAGEATDSFGLTDAIQQALKDFLHQHLIPAGVSWEVEDAWSGIMGMGPTKMPIVTKYSPHITLAVRLGGMGVALGSWVAASAASLTDL